MTASSFDPRNAPDYDTYFYGTEPIPGDTTWAKTKKEKKNNENTLINQDELRQLQEFNNQGN